MFRVRCDDAFIALSVAAFTALSRDEFVALSDAAFAALSVGPLIALAGDAFGALFEDPIVALAGDAFAACAALPESRSPATAGSLIGLWTEPADLSGDESPVKADTVCGSAAIDCRLTAASLIFALFSNPKDTLCCRLEISLACATRALSSCSVDADSCLDLDPCSTS